MPEYNDRAPAFDFVGGPPRGMNRAVYDRTSGRLYCESLMLDQSDIPEDIDWDHCVEVPHKNDLDPGRNLV